ncbi:MAG: hypothetical protein MUE85_03520 [Microscillaceae bacterium]|jgi:hypothetical protein|nr:hypothetical protein [Microscillaceae bacterium]
MAVLTYYSVKRLYHSLVQVFRDFWHENSPTIAPAIPEPEPFGLEETPRSQRAKLRVSLQDLKIISSALLHLKKTLLKKAETTRADEVAQLDQRIYELIQELEQEQMLKDRIEKIRA